MPQVLKYQPGQKYEEHWDWFEEEERKKMDIDDTNRIATILVYLSGEQTPSAGRAAQSTFMSIFNRQISGVTLLPC
jgi:2OG-Fe(II) oxygenase superfamily